MRQDISNISLLGTLAIPTIGANSCNFFARNCKKLQEFARIEARTPPKCAGKFPMMMKTFLGPSAKTSQPLASGHPRNPNYRCKLCKFLQLFCKNLQEIARICKNRGPHASKMRGEVSDDDENILGTKCQDIRNLSLLGTLVIPTIGANYANSCNFFARICKKLQEFTRIKPRTPPKCGGSFR